MAGVTYSNISYDEDEVLYWEEQQPVKGMSLPIGDYSGNILRKTAPTPTDSQEDASQRFASLGIGIASLFSECILTHPCVVIRRQCQLHRAATRYHFTPFTLIPVCINLQRTQGISTMWKGLGGVFILRGITLGVEDLLSKFTPLPKEVSRHSSMSKVMNHLLLKSIGFMIITPFFGSCLVETVQSDIASEKPGIFDCVREGFNRLFNYHSATTSRLIPVWFLIGPTVVLSLAQYAISSSIQFVAFRTLQMKEIEHHQQRNRCNNTLTTAENCLLELSAAFVGHLFADIMLYPLETVVYRLHVQGTRTIIDNLDTGKEVIPIITRYTGIFDCFNSVIHEEGVAGLYKGFGALLAQYAVRLSILRLTKFIYRELNQRSQQ